MKALLWALLILILVYLPLITNALNEFAEFERGIANVINASKDVRDAWQRGPKYSGQD